MAKFPIVASQPRLESTKLDWALLNELVHEVPGPISVSAKFAILTLRWLLRLTDEEARDAITDASQDRGVDAVFINELNSEIHLFQFKCYERDEHTGRQFPARSVDLAISFVSDLLERRQSLLETTNTLLQNKILEIWDSISKSPVKINFHFVSNGRRLEEQHASRFRSSLERYDVAVFEHTASDILNRAFTRTADKIRKKLPFIGSHQEFSVNGRRMIVGLVHLKDIGRLVSSEIDKALIDESLFADNVRGMLGLQNDVNKSMLRTMASHMGGDFVFRNNGITIVAEQLLCQVGANFPVEMVAPQIVNGCQTASTAFSAMRKNPAMLEKGDAQSVFVKIIESRDPQFTEGVALSTNSQTRIYGRDLRAIDETQLKIERLLRRHGFAYLRKRSDVSELPRCQTIDMAKLGQLILSYYRHQPEQAKTRSNDIFNDLYAEVFDVQLLNAPRIIAVHTLNYMLDERRQSAKQRLKSPEASVYGEEWILEGVYHVLYVVSLLCKRDEVDQSDIQYAAARLNEAVLIVGEFVKSHPKVAAYRLFRTVGTGDALAKTIVGTPRSRRNRAQLELF